MGSLIFVRRIVNKFIQIDLNQFKFHISLSHTPALTLHFNSPSQRFYLSMIALVVQEMKRIGKSTSIPLEEHIDLLGLLNATIGGSAGSSQSAASASNDLQKMEGFPLGSGKCPAFQSPREKKKL